MPEPRNAPFSRGGELDRENSHADGIAAPVVLDYTGERMVPEHAAARTFWEHIERYRFAASYARGKRVLDVACGEGYGAAALARAGASQVVGVDISEETCAHARAKYGIDARRGSAEELPLADRSFNLVVSFETLEHLREPARFLSECARVLVPDGLLIVSTPNRPVYRQDVDNPFHHREYDRQEFLELLSERFDPASIELRSQCPWRAPIWSPRALAAERSPWLTIKGFWRLRAWLCPSSGNRISDSVRDHPVDAIINGKPGWLDKLFNPYLTRQPARGEQPWYWIALARPRAIASPERSGIPL